MSDYKKHYLSGPKSPVYCPLQDGTIQCDSYCAWFDHEHQDCRMIGGFWKVVEAIREKPPVDNTELTNYFDD